MDVGFLSGGTRKAITKAHIESFVVPVPPTREQRGIAEILQALDDKVVANRSVARTIDELLPVALEVIQSEAEATPVRLGDVAVLRKGVSYRSTELAPSRTAMVSLKCVDRTGDFRPEGLKEYTGIPRPDQAVLPGELGVAQTDLTQGAEVVGRVVRIPSGLGYERLVASLDLVIVRPMPPLEPEYLYAMLLQPEFRRHCIARTSGTTVLHLASDALPSYEMVLDPPHTRAAFVRVAQPLLAERDRISSENRLLAEVRDNLVPELLTGRIRIDAARELVAST